MWELYGNGQYVACYHTKWDAIEAASALPDGSDWHIVYFSGQ